MKIIILSENLTLQEAVEVNKSLNNPEYKWEWIRGSNPMEFLRVGGLNDGLLEVDSILEGGP